ncbi:MAG: DUF4230 domain-containing protein [Eubacteriales bacterium]|jgi:hypothetical protein|nr:DUF4230 domain-containing protein [Eubacteriales bacterium]
MSEPTRPNAEQLRDESRSAAVHEEAKRKSRRAQRDEIEHYDSKPRGRFRLHHLKWILRGIVLVAILIAVLFFLPKIKALFSPDINIDIPDSLSGLLPDETMGYNKFDFSNAILGEARAKSNFVVLEQDVTVTTRVSQALANLALFEKSQIIRSYGMGVFTVDLATLSAANISLDSRLKMVTIIIPHAALAYVTVDVEKTEFEETKKALFAFGEIKLTSEQRNLLEQNIQDAMTEQLNSADMLAKADGFALSQVQKLFAPIVQSVASEFVLTVEFAQ